MTKFYLIPAIMWCIGILVVSYVLAAQIYKVKLGSVGAV